MLKVDTPNIIIKAVKPKLIEITLVSSYSEVYNARAAGRRMTKGKNTKHQQILIPTVIPFCPQALSLAFNCIRIDNRILMKNKPAPPANKPIKAS